MPQNITSLTAIMAKLPIMVTMDLLNGERIAQQQLGVRLAKTGLALKWIRRDVDAHHSTVEHDGVGRDVADWSKKVIIRCCNYASKENIFNFN